MAKITAHAFDHEGMSQFLSHLDQIHLVAIHKSRPDVHGKYFGEHVESAVEWAQGKNANGFNIYWTVNRVRNGFDQKPKKSDIVAARYIHVDIDPPRSNEHDFSVAATIETLENLRCPPTFIINSGNGLQSFWALDGDCANLDSIERINLQVRGMFSADSCQNIDRLMRVPGAVNWPSLVKEARGRKPAMASVIMEHTGQVYEPEELAAFFPPAEITEAAERASVEVGEYELLTADDLGLTPFHPLRRALEKPKGDDRSAYGYHAACEAVREHLSDAQVAGLLLNPANPASAHFIDQEHPLRAVKRAIGRARGVEEIEETDETPEVPALIDFSKLVANSLAKAEKVRSVPAVAITKGDKPEWYAGLSHGLRMYVDTVMEYAPSPRIELALAAAISCFATAAGRRYQSPTGILTNVYCTALMASGAGKDFPLRSVGQVLTHAGAIDNVGGRIVSAMGVRSALERQPTLFVPIDEMGKLIAAMNNPRGNLKDAVAMLLELYSESQSFTKGGMYANAQERQTRIIHNPCLSFFGVATPSTFWDGLTSESVSDGFLPRMVLFIDTDDEPEPRMDLSKCRWPDTLIDHVKAVRGGAEDHTTFPMGEGAEMPPKPYTVPYSDDAAKGRWFAMKMRERDMRLGTASEKHPFYNRLAENATKIALIRAIDRNPASPMLTEDDFAWGEMLSMRSIAEFERQIGSNLSDSEYHAKVNRIRKIIENAGPGGISASEIGKRVQGVPMRERRDILEDLEDQGAISSEKVQTQGRPRFVYRIG